MTQQDSRGRFDSDAAEDYAMQTYDTDEEQFAFVKGAEWQAAQSADHALLLKVREALRLSLINFPAKRSASLDMLKVMGKIDAALTLIDERLGR